MASTHAIMTFFAQPLKGAGPEQGMTVSVDRNIPGPSEDRLSGPWPRQIKICFAVSILEIEHIFHGRRKNKSGSSEETPSLMGSFGKSRLES